jgi:hypothetical protein
VKLPGPFRPAKPGNWGKVSVTFLPKKNADSSAAGKSGQTLPAPCGDWERKPRTVRLGCHIFFPA